ncbi:alpha/beta hydrolase [Streptomyces rochei]
MISRVMSSDWPGELHLPADFDEAATYRAVVVTHPAGSVKEQSPSPGLYASKLAENGLVALTFDASHQGASGGEPRYLENPVERGEDVRCAVDYLTTLPFVDAGRIGALGICAGAGYSISAATTDRRIKAVAGVSPTDAGSAIREGWDGKLPVDEQIKMLDMVAAQRTAEAKGAAVQYMPYVPEADALDENTAVTMREANNYYRTPSAQHPNSPNKVLLTSLDKLLAFSASDRIGTLLTQPLLLVVGSESDARRHADTFHGEAASTDKEVLTIEGATHVDLYDVPKHVEPAVAKLASFFAGKL